MTRKSWLKLGRRRDSPLDEYWIIASSSALTSTRTELCWFRLAEVCPAQVAAQKTGCMCRPPSSPSLRITMSKRFSSELPSTSTSTSLSVRSFSRQTERWSNGRQTLPSFISPLFFSRARERSHYVVPLPSFLTPERPEQHHSSFACQYRESSWRYVSEARLGIRSGKTLPIR